MATSSYLDLCNATILEAGCELAFFASDGSDFDDPPSIKHSRFKKWVKDAWRDVQQSAPDWHFSVERATVRLHPRITWDFSTAVGATTSLPTGVNYVIRPTAGSDVIETIYVEDGLIRQGVLNSSTAVDCQGYVDLRGDEADVIDFPLNVGSTELAYDSGGGVLVQLVISGWGSYDFNEATQNAAGRPYVRDTAKLINPRSWRISEFGTTSDEGAQKAAESPLTLLPWSVFLEREFDLGSNAPGMPQYITQDFEGRYRFFPALNKDYLVVFDYERGVQLMDEYDDVFEGIPEEFVDLIMWTALQFYGRFEEQPSISNTQGTGRADIQAKMMQRRLERQTREVAFFKPKRLY
jgi:hypothetical protein